MRERLKTLVVIGLILLPLILTIAFKYIPSFIALPKIGSVTIMPPTLNAPVEYGYLVDDVTNKLRADLSTVPGLMVRRTPTTAEIGLAGNDPVQLATNVDAEAIVVTAITVDSGVIQLNMEVVDAVTRSSIYNTPFEASPALYPDMMRAAGAALKRVLSGNAD